jgi:hypothetical protein
LISSTTNSQKKKKTHLPLKEFVPPSGPQLVLIHQTIKGTKFSEETIAPSNHCQLIVQALLLHTSSKELEGLSQASNQAQALFFQVPPNPTSLYNSALHK